MPPFEEGKDNMDLYLQRFERYAEVKKMGAKGMVNFPIDLLKGRALDVYSRLPAEKGTDYDYLKDALLKRFQLTEEGFIRWVLTFSFLLVILLFEYFDYLSRSVCT